MMASVAFTYSALSDGELEDYVAVLESPPGRWLTRVTRAALVEAFQQPPAAPAWPAALRPAVGLPR